MIMLRILFPSHEGPDWLSKLPKLLSRQLFLHFLYQDLQQRKRGHQILDRISQHMSLETFLIWHSTCHQSEWVHHVTGHLTRETHNCMSYRLQNKLKKGKQIDIANVQQKFRMSEGWFSMRKDINLSLQPWMFDHPSEARPPRLFIKCRLQHQWEL